MNTNYLLSVLDLYLLKEQNGKLVMEVLDNENIVKVDFSYSFDHINRTFVKVSKEEFFNILPEIIKKIQGDSNIYKEEKTIVNNKNTIIYSYTEGRRLSFISFSDSDAKKIKLYVTKVIDDDTILDLKIPVQEESYDNIYQNNKTTKRAFSFGFANYMTLFLTTIWILDVFMIALWIFKAMMK